jgi:hypothetical protein
MSRLPAALMIAASCVAAPAAAQQTVLLRFTPPVGQVVHYRTVSQTWMRIPGMPAGDTTQPTVTQMVYTTRAVTAMHGASRVVTVTVDSSRREMPAMGGMMPSGDMLRGMITTEWIDPLGHVDSVAVTPPPGANPMVADAMRRNAGSGRSNLPLPDHAVRPGDSWTDSLTMDFSAARGAGGATTFRLTYRLERIERQGGSRVAVIAMSGSAASDNTAAGGMQSGMKGEYRLDIDASRLVSLTNDMSVEMRGEQGSFPMRMHSVTETLP